MFSHVTLGANNWEQSKPFWEAVASALDLPQLFSHDRGAGYGQLVGQMIIIGPPFDGGIATFGNGTHIAFLAKSRNVVDAFYKAAMDNGGSDEGPPGLRPQYHKNYYGAYVRDPDGNKIQAVCHSSKG